MNCSHIFFKYSIPLAFVSLLIILSCSCSFAPDGGSAGISYGTDDGTEEWGYIDVRTGAHMFWWLYYSSLRTTTEWPLVLWLQGGPGASGVGFGNFQEIGPLTDELTPREFTWLRKADLLFVDSPVGTGFSYVDNSSLLATTDEDVAIDLVSFLKTFYDNHASLLQGPLFIVAESYGGKHATLLGLALKQAIDNGEIDVKLGGVALGNTWISPEDFVLSWGPVLRTFSRVDEREEKLLNNQAKVVQATITNGSYYQAYTEWYNMESLVLDYSNADFYNLLIDETEEETSSSSLMMNRKNSFQRYGDYFRKVKALEANSTTNITALMNGPIREKLQIIPENVTWLEISPPVVYALINEFMKDVIPKVDELLSTGINLTIYSGQLDLICATKGTEAWLSKLEWPGLPYFHDSNRTALFCTGVVSTAAYVKSYDNLSFYWILRAGHMVPTDNPCIALDMLGMITSNSS